MNPQNKIPKTFTALAANILKSIAKAPTTYIAFCMELDLAESPNELDYYCNHQCQIHARHNSHQLLCLPLESQSLLRNNVKEMMDHRAVTDRKIAKFLDYVARGERIET